MQPNQIVVPNKWTSGPEVSTTFNRFAEVENRTTYNGSMSTLAKRVLLQMYRSPITNRGSQFPGTAKTAVKLTIDRVVQGVDGMDLTVPTVIDVSMSQVVGCTETELKELLGLIAGFLVMPEAVALIQEQSI